MSIKISILMNTTHAISMLPSEYRIFILKKKKKINFAKNSRFPYKNRTSRFSFKSNSPSESVCSPGVFVILFSLLHFTYPSSCTLSWQDRQCDVLFQSPFTTQLTSARSIPHSQSLYIQHAKSECHSSH